MIFNSTISTMLIILGGLPGVGKSSIAKMLAEKINAVYLRIDSIEQAIRNADQSNNEKEVFAQGYMAAYAIAKDNLEIGLTVIADSVNPIEVTRSDYRKIAQGADKPYAEIEIICSDKNKHKRRVETRKSTSSGLKLPTWQEVLNKDYDAWETKHFTLDTAFDTVSESVEKIIATLGVYE